MVPIANEADAAQPLLNALRASLAEQCGAVYLAYSGGLDSTAMLHALHEAGIEFTAVHINHGLNAQAEAWEAHCRQQCQSLSLPLLSHRLCDAPSKNIEAWARGQRYQFFAQQAEAGDCVLTAHHQADQAETVLLNLLRGSSEDGLSAMPPQRELANRSIALIRPWLRQPKAALEAYAQLRSLSWIEDDSNQDRRFDRNYLRQEILPRLKSRFPNTEAGLARSAEYLADWRHRHEESLALLLPNFQQDEALAVEKLLKLSLGLRNDLLRYWLAQQNRRPPAGARLQEFWRQLEMADEAARPELSLEDYKLRAYRGRLFLQECAELAHPTDCLSADEQSHPNGWAGQMNWGEQRLSWNLPSGTSQIRTVKMNEKLAVCGHAQRKLMKNLFQELGLPPWQRMAVPVLLRDGQVAAVGAHVLDARLGDGAWDFR